MSRRPFLPIAALLLAALPLAAQQSSPSEALLAPLPVRDQFVLSNGFFSFEPERAGVLRMGEWTADFHTTDSNTFAKSAWISRSLQGRDDRRRAVDALKELRYTSQDTLFLIHGQTHRATLSLHAGVAPNLEIAVAVPMGSIGGGWSDGIIEAVHRALKIGNAERSAFSRNTETVLVRAGSTNYLRDRSAGPQIGDIALSAKYELSWLEDRRVALSLQGTAELPTGDAQTLDGSGSLDAGLQLLMTRDMGRSRLHASLGLIHLGPNRPLGTRSQFVITDTLAATHLLTDRTSATLQLTISESPFRRLGIREFQRRSYQLTAGFQHDLGRDFIVYSGVIENLFTFDNSADAGMVWGISRRF
jgi:hypothetical protein